MSPLPLAPTAASYWLWHAATHSRCPPVGLSVYLAVGPRHTRRASNNQTSFSLVKRRSVQAHDHSNHISKALSYGNRPCLGREGGGFGGLFNHLNRNTLFLHMSFFKSRNLSNSFRFILLLARLCVNILCKRVSFNPGQDERKSILVLILYVMLLKCIFMNITSDWLAYTAVDFDHVHHHF